MAEFEDLVNALTSAAAAKEDKIVHYHFQRGFNYGPLLERMTREERKIIRGKLPADREKVDLILQKINEYEKVLDGYEIEELVCELYFGNYVMPPGGLPEYRVFDAYEGSLQLGRPLTAEEMEEFKIDFSKDDDDDLEEQYR